CGTRADEQLTDTETNLACSLNRDKPTGLAPHRRGKTFRCWQIHRSMRLMKHTVLTAMAACFLLAATAGSAQATEVGYGRKLGLGFVLGDPTGLSGKYWRS